MGSESPIHIFMVSFPAQGHVNPLLRLGKRLASKGFLVTFSAPESIGKQLKTAANNNISGEPFQIGDGFIRFEFFSDGLPEDDPNRRDLSRYMAQLELAGKEILPQIIQTHSDLNRPVSCLINNPFIPWVSDVAESLNLPSAVLWVQSCASFLTYYHYYHNSAPFPSESDPFIDVQLPSMPVLKFDEIPSFLNPSTQFPVLKKAILGQFRNLEKPFCILMDTFQELENGEIEYMSKLCPTKPVGPLFKSKGGDDDVVRGDLLKASDDVMEWLDTKPDSSVVYISFGSVVYLQENQMDEIANAILKSGVCFLWVMKPPNRALGLEECALPDGFLDKAGDKGKMVHWSPQEQVLAHPSVSCFVTHCGWNSSMEAISLGVPVITFPQWGDQVTDAKYLVDVFGIGVRMSRGQAENKLIGREEVEKCFLEAMVGPKAAEMRRNALKWKKAAEAAVAEGGSSEKNFQSFVDELVKKSKVKKNKSIMS